MTKPSLPASSSAAEPHGVSDDLRFADLLDDIVARFDPQLRHTFVNKAVEQSTGRPVRDFIGKTNRELGLPPELVERWNSQLEQVFKSGKSTEIQFAYPGPDGLRHFVSRLTAEVGPDGRVASVVTVAHDVTEVTRIREKIRILEQSLAAPSAKALAASSVLDPTMAHEHFRAIVESSDDAIISKTLDGYITSWNPGAHRIFGYTAAEMLGKSMQILFPPERNNEERFILEKILEGEKVDHFETTRVRKDGQTIRVAVTISPVRDSTGRVIGASKIARDITAQKAAEQRLKLISSVFSNTSEGILIADRAGAIVEVNEAFTRITGHVKEEVIGQHPEMFRSSRQGPEIFQAIRNSLRRTGEWRGEVWSRRKDGEAFSALVTVSAIRSASRKVRNYASEVRLRQLCQQPVLRGTRR